MIDRPTPAARPRILALASRVPWPPVGGDRLRVFHILRLLAERYDVDLVALEEGRAASDARERLGAVLHGVRLYEYPTAQFRVHALTRGALRNRPLQVGYYEFDEVARHVRDAADQYDAVFCFHVRMTEYARAFRGRKIVDLVDAISMNYERALAAGVGPAWRAIYRFERGRLRSYERDVVNGFDRSFVISSVDREYLIAAGADPGRLAVIPNGTDLVPGKNPAAEDIDFVFLGNMETQPNRSAAGYFAQRVLRPLLDRRAGLTYYIVGVNPGKALSALHDGRNLFVTGFVSSPGEYLERARVVVAPMQFAAGVQNKILEAMALGKPVLTTSVGAEGLEVIHGTHCLIADDEEAMQAEALRLIEDEELRRRLGTAGRELVREKYRWEPVGVSLCRHVDEVLSTPVQVNRT